MFFVRKNIKSIVREGEKNCENDTEDKHCPPSGSHYAPLPTQVWVASWMLVYQEHSVNELEMAHVPLFSDLAVEREMKMIQRKAASFKKSQCWLGGARSGIRKSHCFGPGLMSLTWSRHTCNSSVWQSDCFEYRGYWAK